MSKSSEQIRRLRWMMAAAVVVGTCFSTGCGGNKDETIRRSAQTSFDEGAAAIGRKDYAAAKDLLTQAIASGLYPDLCDGALEMRAACHAALGDFTAAQSDIDQMQRGGADESLILAAKAFLLHKQGKAAEARLALQKAKRLNPKVLTFD
jgi:tetratricopeptide (TPR) repeat protein